HSPTRNGHGRRRTPLPPFLITLPRCSPSKPSEKSIPATPLARRSEEHTDALPISHAPTRNGHGRRRTPLPPFLITLPRCSPSKPSEKSIPATPLARIPNGRPNSRIAF